MVEPGDVAGGGGGGVGAAGAGGTNGGGYVGDSNSSNFPQSTPNQHQI